MNLALSHTFVLVHDKDEALSFYRDVLGLQVRVDETMEFGRWVTLSPPKQPEIEIVLHTPGEFFGNGPADREALAALLTKGSLAGLIFATDDLDASFEKVRASGAEVMQEPIDQPYGVRDCAFRDPSGNSVRLAQPLPGHPGPS